MIPLWKIKMWMLALLLVSGMVLAPVWAQAPDDPLNRVSGQEFLNLKNGGGSEEQMFIYPVGPGSVVFSVEGYSITTWAGETIQISFEDANSVAPESRDELAQKSSYQTLVYPNLYNGIDLVFTVTSQGLKSDFLISPGANPGKIVYRYSAGTELELDEAGNLHIRGNTSGLVEEAPYAYQEIQGEIIKIPCHYWLQGQTVSFQLGDYDNTRPLVIDPLIYSSYLGGSFLDRAYDMALDPQGNICVVGKTNSVDFPNTTGCFNNSLNGEDYDIFAMKLDQTGTELLFSTYIGGSGNDCVDDELSLVLDLNGNLYITGTTKSSDFPTTRGCFDDSYNGGEKGDVFVCKLSADGSKLLYSSFLGGEEDDHGKSLALDPDNRLYLGGYTNSPDFPTTPGCFDDSHSEGSSDAFVAVLSPDGSHLLSSTFLGGNSTESCHDLALGPTGDIYLTGETRSPDFPATNNSYDTIYNDGKDIFLARLNANCSQLLNATFLGGSGWDCAKSLVLDEEENIYLTGHSWSEDFPVTPDCLDETTGESYGDAILCKLEPGFSGLYFATYLGGDKGGTSDSGNDIILDEEGCVFITGMTTSSDFPTTPGAQYLQNGMSFLARVDVEKAELLYSTYLIQDTTVAEGMALNRDGDVVIVGYTAFTGLPVTKNALYDTIQAEDGFVLILNLSRPTASIDILVPSPATVGEEVRLRATGKDDGNILRYVWTSSIDGELYNGTEATLRTSNLSAGNHSITLLILDDQGLWSEAVSGTLLVKGEEKESSFLSGYHPFLTVLVGLTVLGLILFNLIWFYEPFRFAASKLLFPLYTRLNEKDVEKDIQQQNIRGRIFQFIKDHPGINLSVIKEEMELGYGTVVYHLSVLQREHFLRSSVSGHKKQFWVKRAFPGMLESTLTELHRLILDAVGRQGEMTRAQLRKELDVSKSTLAFNIRQLATMGKLVEMKRGRDHYCSLKFS